MKYMQAELDKSLLTALKSLTGLNIPIGLHTLHNKNSHRNPRLRLPPKSSMPERFLLMRYDALNAIAREIDQHFGGYPWIRDSINTTYPNGAKPVPAF